MFQDNHYHGQGLLRYDHDIVYEGSFFKSKRHGQGFIDYPTIHIHYLGTWKNDQFNGHGKLTSNKVGAEFIYEGTFKNNLFHGSGTLKFNEIVYEGVWVNGFCDYGVVKEGILKDIVGIVVFKKSLRFEF